MKKFTVSIMAAAALSTFAMAGGDITPPVEPVVETPVVEEAPAPMPGYFYLGLAYSYMNYEGDFYAEDGQETLSANMEAEWDAIMLQAGYQFNPYIGIEGRYWSNLGDGDATMSYRYEGEGSESGSESGDAPDITAWGIYLKPTLPVGEGFSLYGLLGYGNVEIDDDFFDESGFQWGVGASFNFAENMSLFVDYVNLYDDDDSQQIEGFTADVDETIYTVNVGVTYKF